MRYGLRSGKIKSRTKSEKIKRRGGGGGGEGGRGGGGARKIITIASRLAKPALKKKKKNARRVGAVVTVVVAVDRDVDAVFLKQGFVRDTHALDLAPVFCVGCVPNRGRFFFLKCKMSTREKEGEKKTIFPLPISSFYSHPCDPRLPSRNKIQGQPRKIVAKDGKKKKRKIMKTLQKKKRRTRGCAT